ncbi:MAG: superinfection immunity protein [Alphaproteobacteria bacterium]|nr:superinfection immunity protein [Alphaproteobacteria bacterium]MBF0249133.1 superinfection immunity protein [Alphaproteobacteria bacterium]
MENLFVLDALLFGGILILALTAYLLPALIANSRNHHQATAIFVLNLFAGWSGVCWLIALVWSFTAVRQPLPIQLHVTYDAAAEKEGTTPRPRTCFGRIPEGPSGGCV